MRTFGVPPWNQQQENRFQELRLTSAPLGLTEATELVKLQAERDAVIAAVITSQFLSYAGPLCYSCQTPITQAQAEEWTGHCAQCVASGRILGMDTADPAFNRGVLQLLKSMSTPCNFSKMIKVPPTP